MLSTISLLTLATLAVAAPTSPQSCGANSLCCTRVSDTQLQCLSIDNGNSNGNVNGPLTFNIAPTTNIPVVGGGAFQPGAIGGGALQPGAVAGGVLGGGGDSVFGRRDIGGNANGFVTTVVNGLTGKGGTTSFPLKVAGQTQQQAEGAISAVVPGNAAQVLENGVGGMGKH